MNRFIVPVLLVGVSIALFAMFIDPTYKEVQKLTKTNAQYEEASNKSKELRVLRDGLLQRYNSFSATDLRRIKKLIPDAVDNVRLVMDIDSMAAKYGVTIRGVQVDSLSDSNVDNVSIVTSSKDYDSVTLKFTMSATYEDFINFITDLKDSLRLVDVVGIEFTVPNQGSDVYKFKLAIKTYWLK